jgi:hypothetical protein
MPASTRSPTISTSAPATDQQAREPVAGPGRRIGVRAPLPQRRSLALLTATGLLASSVLAACSSGKDPSTTRPAPRRTTTTATAPTTTTQPVGFEVDGWTRLADWPLSPRTDASAVWTGEELLVLGGSVDSCPPDADCAGTSETPKSDGAALDPETGEWHAIADAPVPLGWLDAAVAGGEVYVLQHASPGNAAINGPPAQDATFLRYSPADDEWTELPVPVDDDASSWYSLVAAGDDVIAGPGSDENGVKPVRRFDTSTEAWTDVADDPLPDLFDRVLSFDDGYLYLTGNELVDQPGSDGPSLVLAARYDLAADRWQELPTSESIASGLWPAGHGLLVNPTLGGADGGEVGGWGRWYPEGAMFDTRTLRWEDLPRPEGTGDGGRDQPSGASAVGLINGDRSGYVATGGWAYDGPNQRWVEVPSAPGSSPDQGRSVVAAGPRAISYGGGDWSGPDGVVPSAQIWMWTPPG